MKRLPCSGPGCSQRRAHHERPDEERGTQWVEVQDGYDGLAYCSLTCAAMAGAIKLFYTEAEWDEMKAEQERKEAVCPGHESDGSRFFPTCKRCGASMMESKP